MDHQSNPPSHSVPITVHMTVQQQPTRFFNYDYLKTVPGILKIVQMVIDVVCMCTYLYASFGATLFHTVAHLGFWVTSLLLICCLFYVVQRFNSVPWVKIELYTSGIWTVLFVIVTVLMITKLGSGDGGAIAATIFGALGAAAYGYDAVLKLRDFRAMTGPAVAQHRPDDVGDQAVMAQDGYPKY